MRPFPKFAFHGLAASLLTLTAASGAIVAEWDASSYTSGAWTGTNGDAALIAGTATKQTTSYDASNNISYIPFAATQFEAPAAAAGIAGLAQFTASVVFRTSTAGASGASATLGSASQPAAFPTAARLSVPVILARSARFR